jgi:hypothetical protein
MYSPTIPIESKINPHKNQMDKIKLVHPSIVAPWKCLIKDHKKTMQLTTQIKIPTSMMYRIGLVEREVIPCQANANIFLKGA